MAKEWNLIPRHRLLILAFALGFALLEQPWNAASQAKAITSYACVGALVVLALMPRRTRLWVAICAALAVPLVAGMAGNVLALSP